MKVLTYNVHGWQTPAGEPNTDLVAEVIARTGADLVGLNEVFHPTLDATAALARLAAHTSLHFAFGATQPAEPKPAHPPYGNAILSRWPIMAHAAHHLAPALSYGTRGLLEARIARPSGQPLTVYVLHLDHRSEEARVAQWSSADAWLQRDRARPHLLMGDFNALAAFDYATPAALAALTDFQQTRGWPVPAFDVIGRVLKAGYVDSFTQVGGAPAAGATWPAHEPERRVDYIFLPASAAATLRSCGPYRDVPAAQASDHLPVLADFDE